MAPSSIFCCNICAVSSPPPFTASPASLAWTGEGTAPDLNTMPMTTLMTGQNPTRAFSDRSRGSRGPVARTSQALPREGEHSTNARSLYTCARHKNQGRLRLVLSLEHDITWLSLLREALTFRRTDRGLDQPAILSLLRFPNDSSLMRLHSRVTSLTRMLDKVVPCCERRLRTRGLNLADC